MGNKHVALSDGQVIKKKEKPDGGNWQELNPNEDITDQFPASARFDPQPYLAVGDRFDAVDQDGAVRVFEVNERYRQDPETDELKKESDVAVEDYSSMPLVVHSVEV